MFNENTDEFMSKALKEMDKDKVTKLILDLRSNPGGEVSQAVTVAQNFVQKGLITKLDYKSEGYTDIEYNSYLDKAKYKLAVLVNENSASASEIVTGAIQDTGAGKIIGTKTFGKAKFQGILPILTPEAYAVYEKQFGEKIVNAYDLVEKHGVEPTESEIEGYAKITLGYYYTPKGRMIDGTGLKPDIAVADPPIVSDIDVTSVQKLTGTVKLGLNNQGVDVYNAEKMLKLLGYTVDAADSKLDSKTFSAIKKFQKASKLYANGVLDFTTQKALNNAFDKALLKLDKQYAKAVEVLTSK
jgi:carboxyl-terminal processing protease